METPGESHVVMEATRADTHVVFDLLTCFVLCCSNVSSFQESLLRMLLGIEMLQVRLFLPRITPSRRISRRKN